MNNNDIVRDFHKDAIECIEEDYPSLYQALKCMVNNRDGFHLDIRHDNIMKRKDGTVVLIDPYKQ